MTAPLPTCSARRKPPWLVSLFLWLTAVFLQAHPILQNPVFLEADPTLLSVKLYVSVRELNVVQGLPIATDGTVDMAMAEEMAPRHSAYVLDHLQFRADGNLLTGRIVEIIPPSRIGQGAEAPDRAHFIYRIEYPLASPPAQIVFSHTMVKEFPSAPGVDWDLSYAYRYGPPGQTPRDFGAIPRDSKITFTTGFAGVVASAVVTNDSVPLPFSVGVGLLGLALGLGPGGTQRGMTLRFLAVVSAAFAAGAAMAAAGAWKMPLFLSAALAGSGILLVAVDNIHQGPTAGFSLRRWMLGAFFPAAAGWGAGSVGTASAYTAWLPGLAVLVLSFVLGRWFSGSTSSSSPPEAAPPGRPWLQAISLLVCAGGLAVLFDGLGIRPWHYWLTRLGG